ncbi:leucine-rich repeat neuronal protein 1-like [Armigeres subalbatus]|uniref:leucine-rich repeat neuronal protein 1-like n=1 Tax=Armigeres subalbatus TaxID=124917 RepID=UPI002ED34373
MDLPRKKSMSVITFGKLCFLINILTACAAVAQAEENETSAVMTKLCNFNNTLIDPTDEADGKYCDCDVENSPPWGIPVVVINCQDLHLQNSIFQGEILPQSTIRLELSYNKFSSIPYFSGDKLKYLSLRNNKITAVADKNFVNISSLVELDLSENEIELINSDAFVGLKILRYLNLAENEIKVIQPNAFSPFTHLEHLVLSHNPLGDLFKTSDNDIFLKLGVTPRLNIIELENCSLIQIDLSHGVGLDHIVLSSNQLTQVQKLPRALSHLDISNNPIRLMSAKFLPHLSNLQSLTMEDMPVLYKLDEYALFGLPRLIYLNLQGSRNLTTIDAHVFGKNVILNETDTVLEELILKGTHIRTLNSSLKFAFEQLKTLDLTGTPLNCDCQIRWLKEANFTTHATCAKPASLRGTELSEVDMNKLQCKVEKSWIYTVFNVLLVILLVVLVVAAVYLVYLAIRPRQPVQMRKVGANSPYARVTIEPNQAENL